MNNSRRRLIIIPVGAKLSLITMAAFFIGNTIGPKRTIGAYVHADKLIASDITESQKQYVYTYFTGELEKVYETNIDDVPYVCAQVKERDRTWTVIIGESGRYKGDVLKDRSTIHTILNFSRHRIFIFRKNPVREHLRRMIL